MKASNYYSVECSFNNQDVSTCLTVLYMPLIGSSAVSLYMLLVCENNKNENLISRICHLTNNTINQVEKDFSELEKNGLVKTLFNEKKQTYKFILIKPLSFTDFLSNDYFGRAYLKVCGKEQFEITKNLYLTKKNDDSEFVDVTSKLDTSLLGNWTNESENTYLDIRVDKDKLDNFNTDYFLENSSLLLFPKCLRTNQIINKIKEFAYIYNISESNMITLVGKSTNSIDNTIDLEGLKKRCISFNDSKANSSYDAHPFEFLMAKQNGLKVASSDKKLIEELMVEYKLSNELINYLIEYCLSNNKFTKNYVEKVATNWVRDGIDSIEKASKSLESKIKKHSNVVYEYKQEDNQDVDYDELKKKLFKED